ncbi:TonB family protein [Geochorda subterranea]|uniref:TonB family protein n=1 Tax=Geochorda subterranea TaxID=3109564 RepID=A0ABZ1BKF3_9FIRM|nr:TonB family protein [Limnochorda sp. LNt]WRP13283.1 TonB family protein [Limnochorda sp. LNt]
MSVPAGSSTQPGRLEPFVLVSLVLHAVLLVLLSRVLAVERFVVPMGEGAVVQVIPVPQAPQPTVSPRTTTQQRSAPGGSGQTTPRPSQPAAATAVAAQPRPATQPPGTSTQASSGRQTAAPPTPSTPPAPARASQEVLASERSPVRATTGAPTTTQPSGREGQGATPDQGAQAQGAVARPGGEGTGGVRQGNPPAGPAEPDLTSAVVVPTGSPDYPKNAVTYGVEGRVTLAVQVGGDGKVAGVTVSESSGNATLDTVASRWVAERWQFKPSSVGRPYQVSVLFEFTIDRDEQGRAEPRVSFRLLDERVRYL